MKYVILISNFVGAKNKLNISFVIKKLKSGKVIRGIQKIK